MRGTGLLRRVGWASPADVDGLAQALGERAFDQLLWVAPDVDSGEGGARAADERIIEQQEDGVVAVFRIIKALLQGGYAHKPLQWTFITGRTQRVIAADAIRPTHAGIIGLVGSLAKEYPRWDIRLLDVESLGAVSAQTCLSQPWDKQGNARAYRQGEWFEQGLARLGARPETAPVYRAHGVYVVIGGAGGVGEVWSRFMIEQYQALVWCHWRNG